MPVMKDSNVDVKALSNAYREKKKIRDDSNVVKIGKKQKLFLNLLKHITYVVWILQIKFQSKDIECCLQCANVVSGLYHFKISRNCMVDDACTIKVIGFSKKYAEVCMFYVGHKRGFLIANCFSKSNHMIYI